MEQSESIKNIAKAMSALRKAIKQPAKNANNPFFKSKYVMLEGVVKAIDEALPDGLSYTQEVTTSDNGVAVSTIIMHSSGEYMQFAPLSVPVSKKDAQAFGSAETYARRYTLSAVFGVTSDVDDDGNEAAKHPGHQQTAKRKTYQPKAVPVSKPVNEKQSNTIAELMMKLSKASNGKKSTADLYQFYQDKMNINMTKLTSLDAQKLIEKLTIALTAVEQKQPVTE